MVIDKNFYMNLAICEAWKYQGLTFPNPAVGALILDQYGKIVALQAHKYAGSAHAELSAIAYAYEKLTGSKILHNNPNDIYNFLLKNHNSLFKNFTIFITLQPCTNYGKTPPCDNLISKLGFKNIYIGTNDPNVKLKNNKFILKQKCDELIEPFLRWQRGENFILFKMAKTQNGVYDGGVISSLSSRKFVHDIRSKCDLLVIGGESVRVDRPTLDCRLIGAQKAPDILIYSKRDDFDKSIPLFQVPNRKVFIKSDFEILKNYKYILIEGGEKMFELTKDLVHWYLFFTSPNLKKGKTLQLNCNLKRLYHVENEYDTIEWFKPIMLK